MTRHSPHQLLGVSPKADPLELLGLRPDRCEVGHVELALRSRLRDLDERAGREDGDGRPDDETVAAAKELLQNAATVLKDPNQRTACLARAREKARVRAVQAQFREFRDAQRSGNAASASPGSQRATSHETDANDRAQPVRPGTKSGNDNRPPVERPADRDTNDLLPDPGGAAGGATDRPRDRALHPRRRQRPRIQLTPFDRQVLAVLVAFGGWNSPARSRLTALASMYGVTAAGLAKVVKGLSEFARSGGGHLDVADITGGAARMPTPASDSGTHVGGDFAGFAVPAWLERITPDLSEPTPRTTIRLALLFASVTIVVGIIILRLVLAPGDTTPVESAQAPPPGTKTAPSNLGRHTVGSTHTDDSDTGRNDVLPPASRLAQFPSPPTFSAAQHPDGAVDLADGAAGWVEDLESIARRIALSADTSSDAAAPSDAVFRQWEAVTADIGRSWLLINPDVHSSLLRAVDEVLYESGGRPAIAEQLLQSLTPRTGRLDDPTRIWSDAWRAGVVARVAESSRGLSPAVTAHARSVLTALELQPISNRAAAHAARPPERGNAPGSDPRDASDTFADNARAWLLRTATNHMPDGLVYGDDVLAYWELWLGAMEGLGRGPGHDTVIAQVINHLLRSPPEISVDDVRPKVLGRLLASADLLEQPHVLRTVRRAFDDNQGVSPHALWILTSIMAQHDATAWFESRFVVSERAGPAERQRRWDDINEVWMSRMSTSREDRIVDRPVDVHPDGLARWREALDDIGHVMPGSTDREKMRLLVATAMLVNAAAHLDVGEPANADGVLDDIATLLGRDLAVPDREPRDAAPAGQPADPPADPQPNSDDNPTRDLPPAPRAPIPVPMTPDGGPVPAPGTPSNPPARNPATPVGPDGEWRQRFLEAQRSTDRRIDLIESLRGRSGGDLGPLDAATFADAVYRETPLEVRFAAQQMLIAEFQFGPNVAHAMADLIDATAPTGEAGVQLADTIEQYTNFKLSRAARDPWIVEAKVALLNHALSLRPHRRDAIDDLAADLHTVYVRQVATLQQQPERLVSVSIVSAETAARRVATWWRDHAERLATGASGLATRFADPVALARRAEVRRSLANHTIEQTVAERLAAMEWMASVVARDRPLRVAELERLLDQSSRTRRNVRHILDQAITVERTIAEIWSLRMGPLPDDLQSAYHEQVAPPDPIRRNDRRASGPDLDDSALEHEDAFVERLNALRPQQPMAYFELAEDMADAAGDDESMRDLARYLFGLAGVLDPDRLGRSAALALADMTDNAESRRRLLALASILDQRGHSILLTMQPHTDHTRDVDFDTAAIMTFLEAIGEYRWGRGARAMSTLRREGMDEILAFYVAPLRVTASEIHDAIRTYRTGQNRPPISTDELDAMHRMELAMLTGPHAVIRRPWSADLMLTQDRPLIEVDPDRLDMSFGVDASRPYYRGALHDGHWTSAP